MKRVAVQGLLLFAVTLTAPAWGATESFTVATYNLESYLDAPLGTRPAKSVASKAKVREGLLAMRPDILALQEIGSTNALLELCASLRAEGWDYPHWEHVNGWDTNINVAVLSRFPFLARRSHTNESFLLHGRRFRVTRGFAEVEVRVNPHYRFTLIAAHLKSRREVAEASQAEIREQEAILLRRLIDRRLRDDSELNLVVLGDLNDTPDSLTIRTLVGKGRTALVDTRPAERNGDDQPNANPRFAPRNITWTHYYGKEDSYSRVDYILLSPAMAREWTTNGTYVLTLPNWGVASDHRPIAARFEAADR
jgi:endonuclease/exonuclease/phosphatase family metal-dependent hydrolase